MNTNKFVTGETNTKFETFKNVYEYLEKYLSRKIVLFLQKMSCLADKDDLYVHYTVSSTRG